MPNPFKFRALVRLRFDADRFRCVSCVASSFGQVSVVFKILERAWEWCSLNKFKGKQVLSARGKQSCGVYPFYSWNSLVVSVFFFFFSKHAWLNFRPSRSPPTTSHGILCSFKLGNWNFWVLRAWVWAASWTSSWACFEPPILNSASAAFENRYEHLLLV